MILFFGQPPTPPCDFLIHPKLCSNLDIATNAETNNKFRPKRHQYLLNLFYISQAESKATKTKFNLKLDGHLMNEKLKNKHFHNSCRCDDTNTFLNDPMYHL